MDSELRALLDRMKSLRGEPSEWLAKEGALMRFVAGIVSPVRAFCYGEVHLEKGHFPSILTHNPIYKQTLAWAPSGRKLSMEAHHEGFFYAKVPYTSIAREVLSDDENRTVQVTAPDQEN